MGRINRGVRIVVAIGLATLMIITPCCAQAQEVLLPKPALVRSGESACMSFEGTRRFVLVYQHYKRLHETGSACVREKLLLRVAVSDCRRESGAWRASLRNMETAYHAARERADRAEEDLETEKGWSLRGGAATSVAGLVFLAFAGGYLLAK